MTVIMPSDTRWLAHERCVVKQRYVGIVTALNNMHSNMHEPEPLGLSKALSKSATGIAIFLLDYTFPQIVRLSKTSERAH